MQQAQSSQRPTGQEDGKPARRRLKMMTFGAAKLSFLNVLITDAKQCVELVKRAGARRYTVKTDGRGLIDIEYYADDTFSVALYNHSRWVTNLYIEPTVMNIGNVARAQSMQVATSHITKNEARNVYTTFKVENCNDTMLKRLDVCGHDTSWFSIFSHNANMLMARPHPDAREIELLKNERMYQQRADSLERNRRQLLEKKNAYEKELAECSMLEKRLTRLRDEEQFYAQRKANLAHGIIEVGQAGNALYARKLRLQEERELFEKDQREFDKSKQRAIENATAKLDQQVQTEPPEPTPLVARVATQTNKAIRSGTIQHRPTNRYKQTRPSSRCGCRRPNRLWTNGSRTCHV